MSSLEPPSHSACFIDELIAADGTSSSGDLESQSSSPAVGRGQAWSTLDEASKERLLDRNFSAPSPEPAPPTSHAESFRIRRSRRRIANYICLLLAIWALLAVYLGWMSAGGFAGLQRESERIGAELAYAREVAANATKLAAFRLKHGLPMRNLTVSLPGMRPAAVPATSLPASTPTAGSTTAAHDATTAADEDDEDDGLLDWPEDSWGGINGYLPPEIAAPIAGKLPGPYDGILSPSTKHRKPKIVDDLTDQTTS